MYKVSVSSVSYIVRVELISFLAQTYSQAQGFQVEHISL